MTKSLFPCLTLLCIVRSRVVEEEQAQPEYLQELLQNLLKDLQILNEIQPLKQEISNLIQNDQEEKSTVELLAEEKVGGKQQCLEEMKEWMNVLGIREYQKEEIDIGYRRKCLKLELNYEDGGEIDLDISKIVDISLREKLVESYLLIEKINAFSLSPPIPISPIFCPSSTIPVVDIDLPLEEADVEYVILDEEEDSFTFTTRSFLPFVTYPEVLPASYSTGSEDKNFKPGIFDNDVFKVFRILEASWFKKIVEGQSNSYNFHRWSPIFSS
ncbi:hypothetical protein Tco_0634634 [Tanacetum coccineum]